MAGKPKSAEMHPGPGFRIRDTIERPRPDTIAALGAFETPAISDLMNRLYAMTPAIKNLTDEHLKLLGPATTVKCYPGDNLMVHKALDIAAPGDVIVVDTSGQQSTAVLGDLVSTKARHRGVAGFLVDGLVRDIAGIRSLGDFPVYARDVTPIGPLHRGPGEINFPVSAGGIVVQPGDVIVGDSNGVVVVPRDIAEEMVRRLTAQQAAESDYTAAVARGEFNNNWVDKTLEDAGVPRCKGSNGKAPAPDREHADA